MNIKTQWLGLLPQQHQQQQQKYESLTMLPCAASLLITLMTLMLKLVMIRAAAIPAAIPAIQREFRFVPTFNLTRDCAARECDPQTNWQHLQQMQRYMNPAADPCEDFHEYACGNWHTVHVNATTTVRLADERITQRFVDVFERWQQQQSIHVTTTPTPNSAGVEIREKLLKYYTVCKALEDSGGAAGSTSSRADKPPLVLSGYMAQMHEQNLWRLQGFDWLQTLGELSRFGYSSHFLQHHPRIHNVTYMQLFVQPHVTYESMQWNAEIAEILQDFTVGMDSNVLWQELSHFEDQVVSLVHTSDDTPDRREYTASELMAYTGSLLDWHSYLSKILGRKVLNSDKILVANLQDIKAIAELLQRTDPKKLMLYSLVRFLNYLQLQQVPNFLATTATSKKCIRHMRKNLYLPMNYLYELEFYAPVRAQSDAIIFDVFHRLKSEFAVVLRENAMHLGKAELQWLQLKLQEMRINVGNLPVNVSQQFYSDYVRNLNFSDNFYYNHLHALQHYYAHMNFLISLPDGDINSPMRTFHLNPPTFDDEIDANPRYDCRSNMIYFPYAYLQLPYFSADFPDTLIYGDLANTLAHEIMHGFEPSFLEYNAYGVAESQFAASILANANFSSNLACLNESTQLVGERIADVSGTYLTIRTFLRDSVLRRESGRLFFLQFAQFFCGSLEEETFKAQDPEHDMDSARLNYVVAQTPEFAEAYACTRKSALNPVKRCRMW